MSTLVRRACLTALALAALVPVSAAAQDDMQWWAAVQLTAARERISFGDDRDDLRGLIRGLEGGFDFGRLLVRAGYAEGSLRPGGSDVKHDVAESFLQAGMRVVGGLEAALGVQARAWITSPGTERWLLWQMRLRYEAPLVGTLVHGYAELWRTASGSVNAVNVLRPGGGSEFLTSVDGKRVSKSFLGARGGEAGIVLRSSGNAPMVRIGYSIDQARLEMGSYRDSVEGFTIAVGYDSRRNHFD
jgi:hypothetical protein